MSQKQQFTNFAAGTLASGITSVATTITLGTGQGALFPSLSGAQFFIGTLKNVGSGYLEIVRVTARSADTLTVVRGQEGTTAAAFSTNDVFELRWTAQAPANIYAECAQLDGAAFTGTVTAPTVATADNSTNVATTAFVKAQSYAPLASPAFTGAPTAPTATAGTNNTQLATTAFVTTAIASSTGTPELFPIAASVASNALTLTLNPARYEFRSTTLTTGTVTSVALISATSVVVPSTATLGTTSAQQARLVLLALNNAGTIEAGVINLSGGVNLDETGVISTTAISTGATSANVVYSTTARTNVAYRVAGFIDITEATAGTWATAPSLVQPGGGNAVTSMGSIGYGQTLQNVAGSRAVGTTYFNLTGRPIEVFASTGSSALNTSPVLTIDGIAKIGTGSPGAGGVVAISGIVPPGKSYVLTGTGGTLGTIQSWVELR